MRPVPIVVEEVYTASATRTVLNITSDGTTDLLVRAVTSSVPWAQVFAVVPVRKHPDRLIFASTVGN
jgi:hypothetical protein